MIDQDIQDMITDLLEVRREITSVNRAAGVTVFNPAATDALEACIKVLRDELADAPPRIKLHGRIGGFQD
jgi:hypothetical protein